MASIDIIEHSSFIRQGALDITCNVSRWRLRLC